METPSSTETPYTPNPLPQTFAPALLSFPLCLPPGADALAGEGAGAFPFSTELTTCSVVFELRFSGANSCFAGTPLTTADPTCQTWFRSELPSGSASVAKIVIVPFDASVLLLRTSYESLDSEIGPYDEMLYVFTTADPLACLNATNAWVPTMPVAVGFSPHATQPSGLAGGAVNATESVGLGLAAGS